jgi:hypothetical protein
MYSRASLLLPILALGLTACHPTISNINPTSPPGTQRLEWVKLAGGTPLSATSLLWSTIHVDDGFVGCCSSSGNDPEVCIPLRQAGGAFTGGTAVLYAESPLGPHGNTKNHIVSPTPASAPPVAISAISPAVRNSLIDRWEVLITGSNIFPGAASAAVGRPYAGPIVKAKLTTAPFTEETAVDCEYVTRDNIHAYFSGTLASGDYTVYVENDARYGGKFKWTTPPMTFHVP